MSDLKFSCPSCGQHVQCGEEHAGENMPCPKCAQLIRVPLTAAVVKEAPKTVTENPFAVDESKVSYTPTETETPEATPAAAIPTLEENFEHGGSAKTSKEPVTEREKEIEAARASHHTQPISQVKPRLSFILSGGQAPAREENETALTPEQKKAATPKKLRSDIETYHE